MNLIIIILAFCLAYTLTALFEIVQGKMAKHLLNQEKKRKYKNELYSYKVKKILLSAYHYGLEAGLDKDTAYYMAVAYTNDVEDAFLVDVKYDLLKRGA